MSLGKQRRRNLRKKAQRSLKRNSHGITSDPPSISSSVLSTVSPPNVSPNVSPDIDLLEKFIENFNRWNNVANVLNNVEMLTTCKHIQPQYLKSFAQAIVKDIFMKIQFDLIKLKVGELGEVRVIIYCDSCLSAVWEEDEYSDRWAYETQHWIDHYLEELRDLADTDKTDNGGDTDKTDNGGGFSSETNNGYNGFSSETDNGFDNGDTNFISDNGDTSFDSGDTSFSSETDNGVERLFGFERMGYVQIELRAMWGKQLKGILQEIKYRELWDDDEDEHTEQEEDEHGGDDNNDDNYDKKKTTFKFVVVEGNDCQNLKTIENAERVWKNVEWWMGAVGNEVDEIFQVIPDYWIEKKKFEI